jgi:hypothetical protein
MPAGRRARRPTARRPLLRHGGAVVSSAANPGGGPSRVRSGSEQDAKQAARNPRDLLFQGDPALELTPERSKRDHRVAQVPTLADARLEFVHIAHHVGPPAANTLVAVVGLTSVRLRRKGVPLDIRMGDLQPGRPRDPMHRSAAQSFGSVRHPLRRIWGDDTDARRRLRRLQAMSANRATPALPTRDLDAELALVDGDGNLLRIGQVSG